MAEAEHTWFFVTTSSAIIIQQQQHTQHHDVMWRTPRSISSSSLHELGNNDYVITAHQQDVLHHTSGSDGGQPGVKHCIIFTPFLTQEHFHVTPGNNASPRPPVYERENMYSGSHDSTHEMYHTPQQQQQPNTEPGKSSSPFFTSIAFRIFIIIAGKFQQSE